MIQSTFQLPFHAFQLPWIVPSAKTPTTVTLIMNPRPWIVSSVGGGASSLVDGMISLSTKNLKFTTSPSLYPAMSLSIALDPCLRIYRYMTRIFPMRTWDAEDGAVTLPHFTSFTSRAASIEFLIIPGPVVVVLLSSTRTSPFTPSLRTSSVAP